MRSILSRARITAGLLSLLSFLSIALSAPRAQAGCDNIPSETDVFRAAQGAITAPFAVPGQTLQVRVRPGVCDTSSAGLGTPPTCVDESNLRVTVIYEPGGGAPVSAVVLARDCGSATDPASLRSRVAQWAAQLAPRGTATCQVDPLLDVALADAGTVEECRLSFVFPSATGPSLSAPNTLTGPARIVVEPIGNPLPTTLVGKRCADNLSTLRSIACIDELYARDGSCFTAASNVDAQFPSFTALPVSNDFASMIGTGSRPTLRCALGSGGAYAYCPFDWRGVLCQTDATCKFDAFPPPQLVEVAFPSSIGSGLDGSGRPAASGVSLRSMPGGAESLTSYGTQLPPLFDPSATSGQLGFFGSTDALQTVLAFRMQAPGRCSADQTPCAIDSGCGAGQTCDLSAPDLRLADLSYCRHPNVCATPATPVTVQPFSGGPVQIPASLYTASTDGFIDLATLNLCRGSSDITCLVRSEAFAGRALNDVDRTDPAVLTLRGSKTGARLPIGLDGTTQGLATVLRHTPPAAAGPFGAPVASPPTAPTVTPVVTAQGSCVALLWAEPWENGGGNAGTDANGDGEIFDPILRAFCLDASAPNGIREVASQALLSAGLVGQTAASAQPRIFAETRTLSALQGGGEALVTTGNWLYFLLDDASNGAQAPVLRADVTNTVPPVGGDAPAYDPAVSANGDTVCFASEAALVAGARDRNRGGPDVFCRKFATGVTEVVNRSKEQPKAQALCNGRDVNANAPAFGPSVADDGGSVCYESTASNLLPGGVDKNKVADVFLRNARTCETLRLSLTASSGETLGASGACSLAGAGRFAAFASTGALTAADTDGVQSDLYVTPIQLGTDALANPTRVGPPLLVSGGLPGPAARPSLSRDGTRVAFEHTRSGGGTEVVVRSLSGSTVSDPLGFAVPGRNPRISAEGDLLTLEATNAATGLAEVFVVDLATSIARRQLIAAPAARTSTLDDVQAESVDGDAAGNRVAFTSSAVLAPGDTKGVDAVHVRDVTTQLLKRVGGAVSGIPALSADGSTVAYVSPAGATGTGVFRSGPPVGAARGLRLAALDLGSKPPALRVIGAATQAAVAGATAAVLAPDGSILVRTCSSGGSCTTQQLRAPASTALAQATAVVASESVVCALLQGSGRAACAPAGDPQLRELQAGGQAVTGRAIGVLGRHVVLTTGTSPVTLRTFALTGDAFAPVFQSGPGVRRFVLGGKGWAAFDRCELDAGTDLDADGGLDDECRLEVVDLDTGRRSDTLATVLPCTNEACDASFPFRVFRYGSDGQSVVVRFLSSEAQEGRQLDNNPLDEIVVRDWTPQQEFVLTAVGDDLGGDPLAGLASGGVFNQGGAVFPSLVGRCDVDADPSTAPTTVRCQTNANCPTATPTCGPPFSLLALNDADGDGVFDPFDNCPTAFNPEQVDADGDGAGNTCDLFSCGDGVVDAREFCDEGPRNGACRGLGFDACVALGRGGSFCDAECKPQVFVDVSESAVNPGKAGVLPTRFFGTPYLNYGPSRAFDGVFCAIPGGCPAEMVSLSTVRLEGVVSGATCSGAGAAPDQINVGDFNSDGIADVQTKFQVLDARVDAGDNQACVTGAFSRIDGRFRDARFETRDGLNVK
jgi:hypothetical protein